jgi:hypothetical protein
VCVILTLCGLVLVLIKRNHLDSNLKNLILITNASLLAPLSWQILAFNHMSIHFHLNGIIFYIPYLLYFFILLGFGIQSLWFVTKNKFPKLIKNLQKLFLIFILSFLIITTLLSWIHTRIYNQMSAIITSNPNQKYEQESIKGGIDVVDIIDNYYALDINRSTFNMKVKLVKIVGWAVDTEYASVPIHLLVVNNGNLVRGEIEFFHRDDINQAFKLNNQDNQAGFSFLAPISGIEDVKNLTQDIKIYAINSHNFSRFKKLN